MTNKEYEEHIAELEAEVGMSAIEFAKLVLHGDDEHRQWLLDAAHAYVYGRKIPEPRGGSDKDARIAELEAEVARLKMERRLWQDANAEANELIGTERALKTRAERQLGAARSAAANAEAEVARLEALDLEARTMPGTDFLWVSNRRDELEAEVARLNGQVAEWSRQNMKIIAQEVAQRKRAEVAEHQLAETLADIKALRVLIERALRAERSAAREEAGLLEGVSPGAQRQRERRRRKRALRLAAETGQTKAEAAEGQLADVRYALRVAYRELAALQITEARETLRQALDRMAPTPEEGVSSWAWRQRRRRNRALSEFRAGAQAKTEIQQATMLSALGRIAGATWISAEVRKIAQDALAAVAAVADPSPPTPEEGFSEDNQGLARL